MENQEEHHRRSMAEFIKGKMALVRQVMLCIAFMIFLAVLVNYIIGHVTLPSNSTELAAREEKLQKTLNTVLSLLAGGIPQIGAVAHETNATSRR
jgi:hypothetical protein